MNRNNQATLEKFNDISRYIRFKSGTIELGEINSPFKCFITNKKISFLKGDEEIAYISNDELYITKANIIHSLKMGNCGFFPRENGNLSFRKVGK